MEKIGIVGAGLIGSSWAAIFSKSGFNVFVYDPYPEVFMGYEDAFQNGNDLNVSEDFMKFDIPKAIFCGLALIAAALYFGHGASSSNANPGDGKAGRYQLGCNVDRCAWVIDTATSEIQVLDETYRQPKWARMVKPF